MNVEIIPCKCGGLPFFGKVQSKIFSEYLFFVSCQKCTSVSTFEYSEKEALEMWIMKNGGLA